MVDYNKTFIKKNGSYINELAKICNNDLQIEQISRVVTVNLIGAAARGVLPSINAC